MTEDICYDDGTCPHWIHVCSALRTVFWACGFMRKDEVAKDMTK
jgi:hypothetical protein